MNVRSFIIRSGVTYHTMFFNRKNLIEYMVANFNDSNPVFDWDEQGWLDADCFFITPNNLIKKIEDELYRKGNRLNIKRPPKFEISEDNLALILLEMDF